jgi:hypothetical protein
MRWSKPNTKVVIIVKNTIETNSNDPSLDKNPKYLSINSDDDIAIAMSSGGVFVIAR